ncbi:MAG TPA: DUF84 family protein [Cerasibacillus sp.]|uniref:DUF84 family protein n=1 Tax=Cerasibacillus sp. TaxID=2498711 RepID=UPI002F3F57F9
MFEGDMMIVVGSKNPAKLAAVKAVFPKVDLIAKDVPSDVAEQPFSDQETRLGAINRAKACVDSSETDSFGIGLEGGVMYIDKELFLCNWGALVTPDGEVFTASGARIPLPESIKEQLQLGKELGDVIDNFAKKKDIRKKEGTIGIFTNQLVSRQAMFSHVVQLLKGQWEYANRK